jgi:hypothetical protein
VKSLDIFQVLESVIEAFEDLGIEYRIGGSIASSAYGIARATLDVDLVADLKENHVRPLVERLSDAFYIDEDRVRDAASRQSSFNLSHLESILKIDVFVLKSHPYDLVAFSRVHLERLGGSESNRLHHLASPEDVILNKLDWYRQGGCVSERQWNDVLGVLKIQQSSLNYEYMQHWAEALDLAELLHQALEDAGVH